MCELGRCYDKICARISMRDEMCAQRQWCDEMGALGRWREEHLHAKTSEQGREYYVQRMNERFIDCACTGVSVVQFAQKWDVDARHMRVISVFFF